MCSERGSHAGETVTGQCPDAENVGVDKVEVLVEEVNTVWVSVGGGIWESEELEVLDVL
jgi:hypothetical protein